MRRLWVGFSSSSRTFQLRQHSKTLHLCTRSHLAPQWAARPPLGATGALQWAARAPLRRHLGARNSCSGATVRSKQLPRSHYALETAALESLGARNGCSRAPERSKQPLRSHWALETAAPEHSCSGATVRSKPVLRGHWALETAAPEPLGPLGDRIGCSETTADPMCVRSHCSKLLFEITIRESYPGTTVLCFTSLRLTHSV